MSEMVERVAQAISGDDNPANVLEIHRVRARAAIETMRKPTKPMVRRGWKLLCGGNLRADEIYSHMIDETLQ